MILIGRHGNRIDDYKVEWGEVYGYDPSLSQVGLEQAVRIKELFAASNLKLDSVYSSPFLRTLQTASLIAKDYGCVPKLELRLAEWFNPDWFDYSPYEDLQFISSPQDGGSSIGNYFPESYNDLKERMAPFCSDIELQGSQQNILLVSHKYVIEVIGEILGVDLHDFDECEMRCLTLDSGKWKIERIWKAIL